MSPQVGARDPRRDSFLGPRVARGLKEQTWNRFCGKACSGKQKRQKCWEPKESLKYRESIELPGDASASQRGDRAGSFLGWLCAAEGWTVQPTLNQRHCVQMNKGTLF